MKRESSSEQSFETLDTSKLKVGDVITELDTAGRAAHVSVYVGEHTNYPSIVHAVAHPYYCVMVTRLKPPKYSETYIVHRYHNENVAWLAVTILLIWHVNKVEYQTEEVRRAFLNHLETKEKISIDLDKGLLQAAFASRNFNESIVDLIQMASHLFSPILPKNIRETKARLQAHVEQLKIKAATETEAASSAASAPRKKVVQNNITEGMRCGEVVTAAFNIAQMIFDEVLTTQSAHIDETIKKIQYAIVARYEYNETGFGRAKESLPAMISFPYELAYRFVTPAAMHYYMDTAPSKWAALGKLEIKELKSSKEKAEAEAEAEAAEVALEAEAGDAERISREEWQAYCKLLEDTAPIRQLTALLEYVKRALTRDMAPSDESRPQSAIDFTREDESSSPEPAPAMPLSAGAHATRTQRSFSYNLDDERGSPCVFLRKLMIDTHAVLEQSIEVRVALTPTPVPRASTPFSPSAPINIVSEAKAEVSASSYSSPPKYVFGFFNLEDRFKPTVRGRNISPSASSASSSKAREERPSCVAPSPTGAFMPVRQKSSRATEEHETKPENISQQGFGV